MTVRDIQAHVQELYDHEISKDLVSTITDGVVEEMQEWRNRPLNRECHLKCVNTPRNIGRDYLFWPN